MARVAFGTDEKTVVSESVVGALAAAGHEVVLRLESEPWPDVVEGRAKLWQAGRRIGEWSAVGRAQASPWQPTKFQGCGQPYVAMPKQLREPDAGMMPTCWP